MPLILTWARQQGFQEADALDVAQEVLIEVVARRCRRTFASRGSRSAAGSIRSASGRDLIFFAVVPCARKSVRNRSPTRRCGSRASSRRSPSTAGVVHRACELIRPEFEQRTWRAFVLFKMEQKPVPEVMRELGYERDNGVYVASNRVLQAPAGHRGVRRGVILKKDIGGRDRLPGWRTLSG